MIKNWYQPVLIFSAVTFFGSPLAHIDVRGTAKQALRISLPKFSPAFAAVEDATVDFSPTESSEKLPDSKTQIQSGVSGAYLVPMILPPRANDEVVIRRWIAQIPMGGRLQVKAEPAKMLKGLTIRLPVTEVQPVTVLAKNEDVTLLSKTRELIGRELQKNPLAMPSQKMIGNIFVAGQSQEPQTLAMAPPPSTTTTQLLMNARPEPKANLSWVSGPSEVSTARATLSGTIRLAGGLALLGEKDQVVIFRESKGARAERAQVWLADGRFEISSRALEGRLVGQLKDSSGQVVGQGEIKLASLPMSISSDRIENLEMRILPLIQGAQLEVVSARSYDNQIEVVKDANVWLLGAKHRLMSDGTHHMFSEPGLSRGSSFVAQVRAENHWGTLVVGMTGQENRAQLFPNKLMDALLNLTAGDQSSGAHQMGVIWGKITHRGHPLAGARVEMAGDSRVQPHYFNSLLLPDRFSEFTGENGTFAFTFVTPGIQSVRVIYQGQSWPAQIIPAAAGHVSYMEFELGEKDGVPLEMYDPLDSHKEINSILRWTGDETSDLEIQGRGKLKVPTGPGLMMIEADAGDMYELSRYTLSRRAHDLRLPVVRRDWLTNIAARKRINMSGGVGIVVGFDVNDAFSVQITENGHETASPDIVYFDSRGQALFSDEGIPGGGFAIFNAPPGMQSVRILKRNNQQAVSEVLVVSPEAINVVTSQDVD